MGEAEGVEKLVEEGGGLAGAGAGVVGPGVSEKGGCGVGGGVGAQGFDAYIAEHGVTGGRVGVGKAAGVAAHTTYEGEIYIFPGQGLLPFFELSLQDSDTLLTPLGDGDLGVEAFEGVPRQVDTQNIVEPVSSGVNGVQEAFIGNPEGPTDEVGILADGDGATDGFTVEVAGIDEEDDDAAVEYGGLGRGSRGATEPMEEKIEKTQGASSSGEV